MRGMILSLEFYTQLNHHSHNGGRKGNIKYARTYVSFRKNVLEEVISVKLMWAGKKYCQEKKKKTQSVRNGDEQ